MLSNDELKKFWLNADVECSKFEYGQICYKKGYEDRDKEIVRCKDCKYALPEGRENVYICTAKKNPNYCWFDEYCSCGERRETE